jgi:beta-glucosidase
VTLYHWDLPQALEDAGGWTVRDTALRFAEYAALMADSLGDVVQGWITHNEPWVVAILGHAVGRKAPGIRDWPTALVVAHHLLLSHGLAVGALRALAKAPVGITLNLNPMRGDDEVAARMDAHQNRWFLDPVLRGTYPVDMLEHYERVFGPLPALNPEDLDVISRPIDFLGVNYYNPTWVRESTEPPLLAETVPASGATTAMGWPVDASGLYDLLLRLRADYGDLQIWITENGAAFDDERLVDGVVEDPSRVAFLRDHLEALRRAALDGVRVQRYHAWSLLDNFEWEHGYDKRFGIVRVDVETQKRTLKRSAHWYRDHIREVRGGIDRV